MLLYAKMHLMLLIYFDFLISIPVDAIVQLKPVFSIGLKRKMSVFFSYETVPFYILWRNSLFFQNDPIGSERLRQGKGARWTATRL